MRRVALYGIGWVAAATVAVLLAWQGVGRVGRNVTESHPRALSAEEARQALGEGSGPPGSGPAPTSPPEAGGPSAGSNSTTTTAFRPRATATTAPTAPRPSTPSPTSPTTTRPPAPAPTPTTTAGVVRTYNLVGGSAALRFEPSGKVTVVWANPNQGFRADIDNRDGGGVRVRFDGDSHRSEVEAWWDGGPRDRVEENGGGGGGSGPG